MATGKCGITFPGSAIEALTAAVLAAQDPSDDVESNIVCLDGAVKDLGRGGKILTKALGAEFGIGVWA